MKLKLALKLGLAGALAIVGAVNFFPQVKAQQQSVKFICSTSYDEQNNRNIPTTYAWTQGGKVKIILWDSKAFVESGWTPQKRCEEVSPRFQKAYDNGNLQFFSNGFMNKQRVICTTKKTQTDKCEQLILTLKSDDDSLAIVRQFSDIFSGQQAGPLRHSTKQGWFKVDIDTFLRNAPKEK